MTSLLRLNRPLNLLQQRTFATTSSRLFASSKEDSTTSTTNSSNSESGSQSKGNPQPKILSASPPKDEDAPEDVRRHNEEMAKRADRPQEKVQNHEQVEKDKVGKGFWSGSGGVAD